MYYRPTEEQFKKVGMKRIFPLKPGHVVPLTNDRMFKILVKNNYNRRFLAKIINLVTDIDYDLLVDKMVIIDTNTSEDNVYMHYNDQDVVVSIDNMHINIEMSIDKKNENIRKNNITGFKYASNMYKKGDKYDKARIFYQICIENYNTFHNDLLITEVNLVEVSSGKSEVLTEEYKEFHVNLNNVSDKCYNSLSERDKYFKIFLLDEVKELEELSKGEDIMEDTVKSLKSLSNDFELISELEKQEISKYCERIARNEEKEEAKKEGKEIGERSKQIEIAKNMLSENINIDMIIKFTGLTMDEINDLK